MSDTFNPKIVKHFGPSVLKVTIPQSIINTINNYIDETVEDEKKMKLLNAGNNLVGDVTQEFNL